MIPELDLGIVILTNTMKGIATPVRYYIINEFIEKESRDWSAEALARSKNKGWMERTIESQKEQRVLNTKSTFELSKYTGTYYSDMLGPIQITTDGTHLHLSFDNSPDLSAGLEHWHYDTWEIKWDKIHAWFDFGTIQFHHDNNMHVTGFEFDVPNYDIFFNELKVSKQD